MENEEATYKGCSRYSRGKAIVGVQGLYLPSLRQVELRADSVDARTLQ